LHGILVFYMIDFHSQPHGILTNMSEMTDSADSPQGLVFPCAFPIKIIGDNNEDFEKEVLRILSAYFPDIKASDFSVKDSSGNKYCSLSYSFEAESREQLDQIYRDLGACPYVKWVI